MNSEIFGVIVQFLVAIALSIPLGNYIARVYLNKSTFLDRLISPIEKLLFKIYKHHQMYR